MSQPHPTTAPPRPGTIPAEVVMSWQERIVRDPAICRGEPTFRGTRVLLRNVLLSLARGDDASTILLDYPTLSPEDVRAAVAFAASSAADDIPARPIPSP